MKVHTVPGGGGVKLHVRECGSPTGIPILLIHSWSQNHLCWMKQYESELQNELRIVALDRPILVIRPRALPGGTATFQP